MKPKLPPRTLNASAAADSATVWLIEDNAAFRRALARLLGRTPGLACPHALENAEQALRLLRTDSPPDVVLMDINLPGMNGIAAVRLCKAAAPNALILMLTVFEDNDRVFEAICAGANGYLLKTAPLAAIVAAIHEARQGGAPMSPSIARKVLDMFGRFGGARARAESEHLTPREHEVVKALAEGLSMSEISAKLDISYHTVDTHLRHIYTKLHVRSATAAVAKAVREGLA
jgi:DNA-binding NarL/FixJ family response regulator